MKYAACKRSVVIGGHKTSVSLEQALWQEVRAIANTRRATVRHRRARGGHPGRHAQVAIIVVMARFATGF